MSVLEKEVSRVLEDLEPLLIKVFDKGLNVELYVYTPRNRLTVSDVMAVVEKGMEHLPEFALDTLEWVGETGFIRAFWRKESGR